jgi:hypothetical protein
MVDSGPMPPMIPIVFAVYSYPGRVCQNRRCGGDAARPPVQRRGAGALVVKSGEG